MEDKTECKELVEMDTPRLDLEGRQQLMNQVNSFIKTQLNQGLYFGPIPGCGERNVLLKSGAEKLAAIFNMYPEFIRLKEVLDHENVFFMYEYKCVLKSKKTGVKQAEAIGSCNNREKAKLNAVKNTGDTYGQINTLSKVAQKRAYVSAVIMATSLSNTFSSDEDAEVVDRPEIEKVLVCAVCQKDIDQKVANYSAEKFGKFLCLPCQKNNTMSK
jgi:hypothetical protein